VREELNQRLRDGESGKGLVEWINDLPEVKTALQREFGGRPIREQSISEWKQGGFLDGAAKTDADELMADTLAGGGKSNAHPGSRGPASRRKSSRVKTPEAEMESVSDRVVE
jgi:hypothetical protein